jgi:hypothetical protein
VLSTRCYRTTGHTSVNGRAAGMCYVLFQMLLVQLFLALPHQCWHKHLNNTLQHHTVTPCTVQDNLCISVCLHFMNLVHCLLFCVCLTTTAAHCWAQSTSVEDTCQRGTLAYTIHYTLCAMHSVLELDASHVSEV